MPTCAASETLLNGTCVPTKSPQDACVANGGAWNEQSGSCTGAEQVACEAAGGNWDGACFGDDGPFDQCPDDRNPGIQAVGTACVVAEVVDACPDARNPGIQEPGTTCAVAEDVPAQSANPPGGVASSDAGAAPDGGQSVADGGAVAAPTQPAMPGDEAQNTPPLGGGDDEPAEAASSDDEPDAVEAAGGEVAAGVPEDTLPLTGMTLDTTIAAAVLMLLFGGFAFGEAARATRRRARAATRTAAGLS